jgi:hypothetical protein
VKFRCRSADATTGKMRLRPKLQIWTRAISSFIELKGANAVGKRGEWTQTPPIEIWLWCAIGASISLALAKCSYLPEAWF